MESVFLGTLRRTVDTGSVGWLGSDVPLGDTIGDLTLQLGSSLGNLASNAASRIQGMSCHLTVASSSFPSLAVDTRSLTGNAPPPPKPPAKADEPLTLSHAIARTTASAANGLGTEEPTGELRYNLSSLQMKVTKTFPVTFP